MSKEEAIEELKRNKDSQFNAKVVDAFLEILQEGRRV
jgi:HD-GYP domain-containing protein (c-di-GMP phosphodiesterase class II)